MFGWDVLKRGVPESVRFYIGDLPIYIFFILTHPYYLLRDVTIIPFNDLSCTASDWSKLFPCLSTGLRNYLNKVTIILTIYKQLTWSK